MLPNFLVVGAARSASTWIHECLKAHPDVFVPQGTKELHFFNRPANYARGVDWYERFFDQAGDARAVGEVTPTYLCQPGTAERIHDLLPNVRLVTTLRNPTDRAYSAYVGRINSGEVRGGEDIFAASERIEFDNQSSILEHGRYHALLQPYLRHFGRERLLVLIYEDLKRDPRAYVQAIYRHLGVDASFVPGLLDKPQNPTQFSPWVRRANLLNKTLLRPLSKRLAHRVETAVIKGRKRFVPARYPHMDERTRQRLVDYYREDNRKLAAFLGRDLSEWA